MPLKKGLRPVKKTPAERQAQKKAAVKNRADKKAYNKSYYAKNRAEILKRQKARRARIAKGDTRSARRPSA